MRNRTMKPFPACAFAGKPSAGAASIPPANAANEEANALFREGLIGFTDIPRLVEQALDGSLPDGRGVEDVLALDADIRHRTRERAGMKME